MCRGLQHRVLYVGLVIAIAHVLLGSGASGEDRGIQDKLDDFWQDKLDDFWQWLKLRGVRLDTSADIPMKIVLSSMQEGVDPSKTRPQMKVVATRNIRRGEDIAIFPSSVMLHAQSVEDPYKPGMEDSENWKDYTAIAAWLLREKAKGNASQWWPYISILPEFVPLTYTFSMEGLQLFEDHRLFYGTLGWVEILTREYNRTRPEALANATFDEFRRAMSVVMSRVYSSGDGTDLQPDERNEDDILDDGAKFSSSAVVIPLADMVNHGDRCTWRRFLSAKGVATNHKDGGFVFRAIEDIAEGEEIMASYGLHDNGMLALIYGYIPDINLDDYMAIVGSVNETVQWVEEYTPRLTLKSSAKQSALNLVNEAQAAVEKLWEDLEVRKRDTRSKWRAQQAGRSGEEGGVSKDDGEGAVEFLGRSTYHIEDEHGQGRVHAVWSNGLVDPRILGALAALVLHQGDLKKGQRFDQDEGGLAVLANASIAFGWNLEKKACDSAAVLEEDQHRKAMLKAGAILQKRLEDILEMYPTTASTDRKCLARVEMCDAPQGANPDEHEDSHEDEELAEWCTGEVLVKRGTPKHEVIMGLKFRIHRKELMQALVDRLKSSCSSAAEAA